jgi:hypothetical protein
MEQSTWGLQQMTSLAPGYVVSVPSQLACYVCHQFSNHPFLRMTMSQPRQLLFVCCCCCCGCGWCCCCWALRIPGPAGAAGGQLGWFATTTGNQISSRLLSARSANALLELPRAAGVIETGSTVSALLIDDLGFSPQDQAAVPPTPGFV